MLAPGAARRLICLLALLLPLSAHAQQGVVRGRVVSGDSAGGRAVEGVEITLPALGRLTRTADDGGFVLEGVPAGTHALRARSLGFEPATRTVALRGGTDTATVTVTLVPRVVELTTVAVRAKAEAPVRRASERARAMANGGAFVDDTLLARHEHSVMSNVLRRIPGAAIIRYPSNRGAYNVLGSSRGSAGLRGGSRYCLYQIYIDGVRRYVPASGGAVEPPPDVDEFKVVDYEAVEIYRGGAQTPMEYGGTGAACGTALFWSRTRPSR
jgi:hypothetical protein